MAAFAIQPHGRVQEYEAGKGHKGVDVGLEIGVSYEVAVCH